jgi:drug/metabolite transporter (DMT)-like permease
MRPVTGRVALALALALTAAFLYAISNVLEQIEAEQVADEYSLHVSLIARLIRRPRWVLGFVADAGGYITSAAALAYGAVVFVQPMLSIGLLVSLLLSSVLHHRRVQRNAWLAAFLLCGGLALFLYEVSPTGGRSTIETGRALLWAPVIAVTIGGCLLAAWRASGPPRATLMACAAATSFATSAVLTKAFVHYLGDGLFAWAPHWEPYALTVLILGGFVVSQSSFQVGFLAASVAGLESTQPVVAVVLGVGVLNEKIGAGSPADIFGVVVAALAIVYGIIVLAHAEAETMEPMPMPAVPPAEA